MTVVPGAAETASAPTKIDWRLWLAIFGLWLAPAVTVTVSPLINAAAMSGRDLDAAQIGLARTCEVLLNASMVIWLSTILPRLKPRLLGLTGVLMIAAGNAWGAVGHDLWDLIAARVVAGIGAACALSAGAALIARIKSPQRLFGAVSPPITLIGITCAYVAGQMTGPNGQLGVFGVVSAAALLGALFVLLAPSAASAPGERSGSLAQFLRLIRTPYVLACLFCFVGGTAVWAFFVPKGVSLGLSVQQVTLIIIGVAVATGAFATLGAAIRDRWVPGIAIAAVIGYTIGTFTIPLAPTVAVFIAAQTLTSFSYVIIQNTFTTISARIDRTGSMTAAGLGWTQLANSTAPLAGGLLLTLTHSYVGISALCVVCGLASITFILIAVRRLPPP